MWDLAIGVEAVTVASHCLPSSRGWTTLGTLTDLFMTLESQAVVFSEGAGGLEVVRFDPDYKAALRQNLDKNLRSALLYISLPSILAGYPPEKTAQTWVLTN